MSPPETSGLPDYLDHPLEALIEQQYAPVGRAGLADAVSAIQGAIGLLALESESVDPRL